MVWLPFSKKASAPETPTSGQIEQRSHNSLGVIPNSDIDITLKQIADTPSDINIVAPNKKEIEDLNKSVTTFVKQRPDQLFIIDGEKHTKESIICTNNESNGKTCLKLGYNSFELFKQMQRLEYFCSLPQEIESTYFECRKIR